MQLTASYPITQNNLLSLNVGAGYDKYFDHDQYSTWFLQSGTELSFDIYVKDFWFNLHDRVNYVQDTSQQPALSGTANYATLNNTAGLSVTWDLNKVTLSAGYDHQNIISPTAQQYESQDGATEMVYARAGLEVYPGVTTGIEGTAAFTTYDQMVLNNNNSYSAGVYADWQPGKAFRVQPRFGYTIFDFQHTSTNIQTSNLNSWYADLNITHQVTDAIGYTLDAGHEVQTGIQSDAIEDYYVRPAIHWDIIKNVSLNTSISYEHGNQGAGKCGGQPRGNLRLARGRCGRQLFGLEKALAGLELPPHPPVIQYREQRIYAKHDNPFANLSALMNLSLHQPNSGPRAVQKPAPHGHAVAKTLASPVWLAALCLLFGPSGLFARDFFFTDLPVYQPRHESCAVQHSHKCRPAAQRCRPHISGRHEFRRTHFHQQHGRLGRYLSSGHRRPNQLPD